MAHVLGKSQKGRMMIGKAGEFRVASLLLLLGHVPSLPSVDTGVDVILDNGVRIQVKSSHLRQHKGFPIGAYCFSTQENNHGSRQRDWTKVCDFLVFWAIDEDRFFVVPAESAVKNFWVQPKTDKHPSRGNKHLEFEDRWELLDIDRAIAESEAQVSQGVL